MAGAPSVTDSELELHFAAYDEIFRAALTKTALDDAGRTARLDDARAFLRANVQHTDDFIAQIGGLARVLGVKEPALGAFIGANFLKALQMVRRRAAQAGQAAASGVAPGAAAQTAPAAKKYTSILHEIVERFGPIVSGGQFVPLDDGFLKFVGPAGEILPMGLSEGSPETAKAPGAATSPAPGSVGADRTAVAGKSAETAPAERPAPAPRAPEKPILKEILERFGSVLDVHGKLEPSNGLEGGGGVDSDEDEEGDDELHAEGAVESSIGAQAGTTITSARSAPAPHETSIIAEILEKFGSHLDVHEKLVPSTGVEPGDYDDSDSGDEDDDDGHSETTVRDDSGYAAAGPAFPALPLDFEAYMATLRRVQQFQTNGQDAEYRRWLSSEASPSEKAMVGLRNLEARAKGEAVDWDAHYASLSAHLEGVSTGQLANLHQRLRGFGQIHQLIGRVKAGLQGKPQPFVNAMRAIWPNLLLLLNEDTDVAGYQAEFRIAMLAIPDASARGQVETFLRPVFEKLAGIYESTRL